MFIDNFEEILKVTKNILVCPLDWGLGHATRLVPVIDLLLRNKQKVIIGADNSALSFLTQRFPQCQKIRFPGFVPSYPAKGSMALMMLRAYPEMMKQAEKSKQLLQNIIETQNIDMVISDNRYELSSQNAYCIFISHQLNIQTPGVAVLAKPFIQKKINRYIQHFDELWIPDFENETNLSGKLAHHVQIPNRNSHFIGPLSRFSLLSQKEISKSNDLLILLSGPEPQRTILEQKLVKQALNTNLKTIVLQGKPGSPLEKQEKNVRFISHLPDAELAELIKSSRNIICRSGYSTIMDLAILGSKAIFIPTPGQTEQEYLAKKFLEEHLFYSENQDDFNLEKAIQQSENYSGLSINQSNSNLEDRVQWLLKN